MPVNPEKSVYICISHIFVSSRQFYSGPGRCVQGTCHLMELFCCFKESLYLFCHLHMSVQYYAV